MTLCARQQCRDVDLRCSSPDFIRQHNEWCQNSLLANRHPATTWNQKKIWEAEQADLKRKKDEATANKELKRDSDRRFYENMAGGKQQDASSAALNFMYNPPPGYQQVHTNISICFDVFMHYRRAEVFERGAGVGIM